MECDTTKKNDLAIHNVSMHRSESMSSKHSFFFAVIHIAKEHDSLTNDFINHGKYDDNEL